MCVWARARAYVRPHIHTRWYVLCKFSWCKSQNWYNLVKWSVESAILLDDSAHPRSTHVCYGQIWTFFVQSSFNNFQFFERKKVFVVLVKICSLFHVNNLSSLDRTAAKMYTRSNHIKRKHVWIMSAIKMYSINHGEHIILSLIKCH